MPDHKVDHEWMQGTEQKNFDGCVNAVQAVHSNGTDPAVSAAVRADVEPHVRAELFELAAWLHAANAQVNEAERVAHRVEIAAKASGIDNGARGERAVISDLQHELRIAQIVDDRAERRLGEARRLATTPNNEAGNEACAFGVVGHTTVHEARVMLEDVLTKGRDFVVSHSDSDYLRNQHITASVPLSVSPEGTARLYVQSGATDVAHVTIAFREAGGKGFRQDSNITVTCNTFEAGPPKWTAAAGGTLNATAAMDADGKSFVALKGPQGMVTGRGESVVFRFEYPMPAVVDDHSRSTSVSGQGDIKGTAGARVPAGPATVEVGAGAAGTVHADVHKVHETKTEWAADKAGVSLSFEVHYVGPVKDQVNVLRGAR